MNPKLPFITRILLTTSFVTLLGCASTMRVDEPVRAETLKSRLSELGTVQEISDHQVQLVSEDPDGPNPEDFREIERRNVEAVRYLTPVHQAPGTTGIRERVFLIHIDETGRDLEFDGEYRSCFPSGMGISGIPVGGGCVESHKTEDDVAWFEDTERRVRAQLK